MSWTKPKGQSHEHAQLPTVEAKRTKDAVVTVRRWTVFGASEPNIPITMAPVWKAIRGHLTVATAQREQLRKPHGVAFNRLKK
jgi:hypothetical protein